MCKYWNGKEYVEGDYCRTLSYNAYNTTCSCSFPFSSNISQGTIQLKIISQIKQLYFPMQSSFIHDGQKSNQNNVVVIFFACILGFCMILAIPIATINDKTSKYVDETSTDSCRTVLSFFHSLFPDGFVDTEDGKLTMTTKILSFLRKRLVLDHQYITLFRIMTKDKIRSYIIWINICVSNATYVCTSIVAVYLLQDKFYNCSRYNSANRCNTHKETALVQINVACEWSNSDSLCSNVKWWETFIYEFEIGVFVLAISVLLNVFFAVNLQQAISYVMYRKQLRQQAQQIKPLNSKSVNFNSVHFKKRLKFWKERDEFRRFESPRSIIMRTARISKVRALSLTQIADSLMLSSQTRSRLYFGQSSLSMSYFESIAHKKSAKDIYRLLSLVKVESQLLKGLANGLKNEHFVEQFIVKAFVYFLMPLHLQPLVARILLQSEGLEKNFKSVNSENSFKTYLGIGCCIYSCLYIVVIIWWSFWLGIQVSSTSQPLLFTVIISVALADILFVQVLNIAIEWIFLHLIICGGPLVDIMEHLRLRSKLVLMRSSGLIREATCALQQLNPICLVAADFAHLPVCRLIVSMNDADIIQRKELLPFIGGWSNYIAYFSKLYGCATLLSVIYSVLLHIISVAVASCFVLTIYEFLFFQQLAAIIILSLLATLSAIAMLWHYSMTNYSSRQQTQISSPRQNDYFDDTKDNNEVEKNYIISNKHTQSTVLRESEPSASIPIESGRNSISIHLPHQKPALKLKKHSAFSSDQLIRSIRKKSKRGSGRYPVKPTKQLNSGPNSRGEYSEKRRRKPRIMTEFGPGSIKTRNGDDRSEFDVSSKWMLVPSDGELPTLDIFGKFESSQVLVSGPGSPSQKMKLI